MLQQHLIKNTKYYAFFYFSTLIILFTAGMNFLIPNYGGSGFEQPHNVVVAFLASILIGISFLKCIHTKKIYRSKLVIPMVLLVSSLIIPSLINYSPETQTFLIRFIPLLGIIFISFSISQFLTKKSTYLFILYIISISGLVQALYYLAQMHLDLSSLTPYVATYPLGIFQQRNLLSTYLATTLLVSLYLALKTPYKELTPVKNILSISTLTLSILSAFYIISQLSSRAAIIGLILGLIFILIPFLKELHKKTTFLLMLIFFLLLTSTAYLQKQGLTTTYNKIIYALSSFQKDPKKEEISPRIIIWQTSYATFLDKPFIGHGLGNFQKYYKEKHLAINQQLHKKNTGYSTKIGLSHPHNELLFWAVEGGILPVVGIVTFLIYYVFILFKSNRRNALLWLGILSPIALQTLTSYPFYMSAPHLVVFIILISLSIGQPKKHHVFENMPLRISIMLATILFLVMSFLFTKNTLAGTYHYGLFRFTHFQNEQLLDAPLRSLVWNKAATEQKQYKNFLRDALAKNTQSINNYIDWLKVQIQHNEAPTLYSHLTQAYLFLGYKKLAQETINTLRERYPATPESTIEQLESYLKN